MTEVCLVDVTEPIEEYLEFPGGKVHVMRGGTGAPVLFLHAAGGAATWHPYLARLAGAAEVIAPDHPGFGGTDELPEVEAMDDLVYHYLDVLDRLGLDRPHVVGGSFGGWIAAELAVAAPHRVGSLTLLGAVGLRLPEHPVADLFIMTPDQLVDILFKDTAKAAGVFPESPDVDQILAAYRDATGLARFCWVPFMSNPKLERRLHRITAPTQVIWAADDRLVPIAHGRRYAELIPNARFAVVEDCGHAMYFERPAEFAELTAAFLTSDGVAR
jgi:pimeloyl-ACP methyl ester carboxylesterase